MRASSRTFSPRVSRSASRTWSGPKATDSRTSTGAVLWLSPTTISSTSASHEPVEGGEPEPRGHGREEDQGEADEREVDRPASAPAEPVVHRDADRIDEPDADRQDEFRILVEPGEALP